MYNIFWLGTNWYQDQMVVGMGWYQLKMSKLLVLDPWKRPSNSRNNFLVIAYNIYPSRCGKGIYCYHSIYTTLLPQYFYSNYTTVFLLHCYNYHYSIWLSQYLNVSSLSMTMFHLVGRDVELSTLISNLKIACFVVSGF